MSKTITLYNDDGDEEEFQLPSKKEVCDDCGGEGYVLCSGMRGAAYSMEEFMESFDDEEDRQEYFRPGGKYDVVCPSCHGKNVVDVIDEGECNKVPALKEILERWYVQEEERHQLDRIEAAERRMGC